MQLTTLTAMLATALAVGATPLESRAPPSVFGRLFPNAGCGPDKNPPGGVDEFPQGAIGECRNITTVQEIYFERNTLTRPLQFRNAPCGQNAVNTITITTVPNRFPQYPDFREECKFMPAPGYKSYVVL